MATHSCISCLENPMDRGAWWATVHGVAKSQTPLSDWVHTHDHVHNKLPYAKHTSFFFAIIFLMLYIHELIDSFLFKKSIQMRKPRLRILEMLYTSRTCVWECIWLQSHNYTLYFFCFALPSNHILCSQTKLLSVPFVCNNFCIHFCFFRNAFLSRFNWSDLSCLRFSLVITPVVDPDVFNYIHGPHSESQRSFSQHVYVGGAAEDLGRDC